ncbi:MAG: hypothetical protein K6F37_10050 [Lachnospiraceae bacterium]|nr:hypothetical protein [Lachnospiraceae bacterium]
MRFKYYLRGAGFGILITAIIMSIGFGKVSNTNDENNTEVAESTEDHGETLKSAAENEASDTETEIAETEALSTETQNTETEATEVSDTEAVTSETENTEVADTEITTDDAVDSESNDNDNTDETTVSDENTSSEDAENSSETKTTRYKTVSVIAGEDSIIIANRLQELGIISDAADFNRYLEKLDYDNLLRPGTYEIEEGLDYESLANILMKR